MKIAVAPSSFKGSLSALRVALIIKDAINSIYKNVEVIPIPVSDGGEGLVDNLEFLLNVERITTQVNNPLMHKLNADYAVLNNETVILEMASASGLTLLKNDERNPLITTTFGTGELLKDAIERGFNNILIGAGGSATCDCGVGTLTALGFNFTKHDKTPIYPSGKYLNEIDSLDINNISSNLIETKIKVLCDVTNEVSGENGTAAVFAKQKGASVKEIYELENNVNSFVDFTEKILNLENTNIQYSGAAGGLAYGLHYYANAELTSGIDFFLNLIDFKNRVKDCNLIITGEGFFDNQTLSSKAPVGVARIAKESGIPLMIICGDYDEKAKSNFRNYFKYFLSLKSYNNDRDELISKAEHYLRSLIIDFFNHYEFN